MADLDLLLTAYRRDTNIGLDDLLAAATRYATTIAARAGHPEPQDIGQLAAIRLWQSHETITSSCRWWLVQTTRRLIINDVPKSSRWGEIEEEMPTEIIRDTTSETPVRDYNSVPGPLKEIATMLALGYTRQEIADHMRCSIRTLERRIAGSQTR